MGLQLEEAREDAAGYKAAQEVNKGRGRRRDKTRQGMTRPNTTRQYNTTHRKTNKTTQEHTGATENHTRQHHHRIGVKNKRNKEWPLIIPPPPCLCHFFSFPSSQLYFLHLHNSCYFPFVGLVVIFFFLFFFSILLISFFLLCRRKRWQLKESGLKHFKASMTSHCVLRRPKGA